MRLYLARFPVGVATLFWLIGLVSMLFRSNTQAAIMATSVLIAIAAVVFAAFGFSLAAAANVVTGRAKSPVIIAGIAVVAKVSIIVWAWVFYEANTITLTRAVMPYLALYDDIGNTVKAEVAAMMLAVAFAFRPQKGKAAAANIRIGVVSLVAAVVLFTDFAPLAMAVWILYSGIWASARSSSALKATPEPASAPGQPELA